MKRMLKLLKNEWERVLFWLAVAVYAVALLAWGIGFGREKPAGATSQAVPSQPSLLNQETAFAFRRKISADAVDFQDPFVFNLKGPARQPPPPANSGSGDSGASAKGVTPSTAETAAPPPPAPPPPAKKVNFEYLGCMTTASGQKVALLKDADSGKTGYLIAGEKFKVEDKEIEIIGFTEQIMTVNDAKGTEVQIEYGKRIPIIVE